MGEVYLVTMCVCVCVYALTNVVLPIGVSVVQHFQQLLLNEGLLVERPLVLDDLDGYPRPLLSVIRLHHLVMGEGGGGTGVEGEGGGRENME